MINIAVIIVNYNSGTLLIETVNRVLKSSVPVNIYISDNNSQDESIELVKQEISHYSNLHILQNQSNLGFSAANNIILSNLISDYYVFLNPDCFIEPNTIELMIASINQHSDAGMAGCLIINSDGTEQKGCRRSIPTPWRSLLRVLHLSSIFPNNPLFQDFDLARSQLPDTPVYVEAISGAFMLVTHKALESVGSFDSNYFLHCEDLDLCMRFNQAGFRILFVPNVIITHIKGSCSISRPLFVEWHKHRGMILFYNKFFKPIYPLPVLWIVTIGVWFRFALIGCFLSVRRLINFLGFNRA